MYPHTQGGPHFCAGQVVFVLVGIQGKPDLSSVPQGKAGSAKKRHSCVDVRREF